MPAVEQSLQCFLNLVRRKIMLQFANELPTAPPSFSDCRRQRTVKFAVEEELPVLGIEADDVGRQDIDSKIRRGLRNVIAVRQHQAAPVVASHEVSMPRRIRTAVQNVRAGWESPGTRLASELSGLSPRRKLTHGCPGVSGQRCKKTCTNWLE